MGEGTKERKAVETVPWTADPISSAYFSAQSCSQGLGANRCSTESHLRRIAVQGWALEAEETGIGQSA